MLLDGLGLSYFQTAVGDILEKKWKYSCICLIFFKCPPYENTQIHKHKYMDLDQAVVGLLPAFILENARFDAKIPT